MAEEAIERARRAYAALIDSEKTGSYTTLDVEPDTRADEVRDTLEELFRKERMLSGVMIRVDGHDIGLSTPEKLYGSIGTAGGGDNNEIGSADRGSLPGLSTWYRPVWFACPDCGARNARAFYDERDIPVCPNPSHKRMELKR